MECEEWSDSGQETYDGVGIAAVPDRDRTRFRGARLSDD